MTDTLTRPDTVPQGTDLDDDLAHLVCVCDLKDGSCTDCGGRFPHPAMEWDHIDADTKVGNISKMLRRRVRLETILAEIAKCDLVCANCHRIRTHNRSGGDSRWLVVVDEEDAVNPPRRRRTFR